MSNFGWIYFIDSNLLARQKVKIYVENQAPYDSEFSLGKNGSDEVITVKAVVPEALPGPGEVRDLLDWIQEELEYGQDEEGGGSDAITEFFLSYGLPGIAQVAQFEPEWMMSDDLELLSQNNQVIRQRLGLGAQNLDEMYKIKELAWEAHALPAAIGLLRRLDGWFILSREDIDYLLEAFEQLPEDDIHSPGEWEEVFDRHRTYPYDFAAVLHESML